MATGQYSAADIDQAPPQAGKYSVADLDPKENKSLFEKFMDVSAGAQSAAENFTTGAYDTLRKAVKHIGVDLPEVSPELAKGSEVPADASGAFKFGRNIENVGALMGSGGPAGAAAVAGAESHGDPVAMLGAGLTAGVGKVIGKTVPAVARFIQRAPTSQLTGAGNELLGSTLGYRGAKALKLFNRISKWAKSAQPEAEAVAPAEKSLITPGEAAPAARPDWRDELVQELNKGPQELPGPTPEPSTAPPETYIPEALKKHPQALEVAKKLQASLGGDALPAEPPTPRSKVVTMEPGSVAEAVNRDKRAVAIANFLHQKGNGITLEDASRMEPEQWRMADQGAAEQFGMKARGVIPSPATRKQALEQLGRLERSKQLSQKLADELAKNPPPVIAETLPSREQFEASHRQAIDTLLNGQPPK